MFCLTRALSGCPRFLKVALAFALAVIPSGREIALAYDGPVYNALQAPLLKIATNKDTNPQTTAIRLTRDTVEMRYGFKSAGDRPKGLYVYIPLPPIDSSYADNAKAFGGDIVSDPLGLKATINGASAAFGLAVRTTFLGIDVGDALRNAGVPLVPFGKATADAIAGLPEKVRNDLSERGIVSHWGPMWSLETTYFARQHFEPKKPAEIVISYRPVFGTDVESIIESDGKLVYGLDAGSLDFLCLTPPQFAQIRKRFAERRNEEPFRPYVIHRLEMKLENANQQFSTIYGLTFTVETRKAADILATCGGKFTKTGQRQYTWKDDFAEPADLKFFFLEAVE